MAPRAGGTRGQIFVPGTFDHTMEAAWRKKRLNSLSTDWLADSVEDKAPRLQFRALKITKTGFQNLFWGFQNWIPKQVLPYKRNHSRKGCREWFSLLCTLTEIQGEADVNLKGLAGQPLNSL